MITSRYTEEKYKVKNYYLSDADMYHVETMDGYEFVVSKNNVVFKGTEAHG